MKRMIVIMITLLIALSGCDIINRQTLYREKITEIKQFEIEDKVFSDELTIFGNNALYTTKDNNIIVIIKVAIQEEEPFYIYHSEHYSNIEFIEFQGRFYGKPYLINYYHDGYFDIINR